MSRALGGEYSAEPVFSCAFVGEVLGLLDVVTIDRSHHVHVSLTGYQASAGLSDTLNMEAHVGMRHDTCITSMGQGVPEPAVTRPLVKRELLAGIRRVNLDLT